MTSATERLRALLDERGVEWQEHRHVMPGSMAIQRETLWGQPTDAVSGKPIPHVYHYRATEMGDGRLFLEAQLVSPEQAVAATLGPGTCEVVSSTLHEYEGGYAGSEWEHELSCGDTVWWGSGDAPEWCPWCGRKVDA